MENADLPAMPNYYFNDSGVITVIGGLTKREQFAMAAMQSMLTNDNYNQVSRDLNFPIGMMAANMADSLLAELERSK